MFCPSCNTWLPRGAIACYKCQARWAEALSPEHAAVPVRRATPPATYSSDRLAVGPGYGQIASVGRRVGAYLIDGAILFAVLIGALIAFGIVGWPLALGFALWVIAAMVYRPYLESTCGQTYGKRWLGLRVVAEDGSPATTGQCVKRALGWGVDGMSFFVPLGFVIALMSQRNQRLGDMWARTLVIND